MNVYHLSASAEVDGRCARISVSIVPYQCINLCGTVRLVEAVIYGCGGRHRGAVLVSITKYDITYIVIVSLVADNPS